MILLLEGVWAAYAGLASVLCSRFCIFLFFLFVLSDWRGVLFLCNDTLFSFFLFPSGSSPRLFKFLLLFYLPAMSWSPSKQGYGTGLAVGRIIRTGEAPADPDMAFLLVFRPVSSRL
ncbi:hypothetical protein V8C34DRAFT_164287 [Trichoderma compactum]